MKTHDDILNFLQADIICFQEMKSSRQNLTKAVAVPPSYDSLFSFPIRKNGYSGVAVYTRSESVVPCKAEEGLTGLLQPKPLLSPAERISSREAYPDEIMSDESADLDFRNLDSEGRALVVDFGLFVLINVYCPNDGTETEERLQFKADFHRTLEARVKGLVEVDRREVIVVGDINACAAVVDHCEGELMMARGQADGKQGDDGFWDRDVRRWLRDWLISEDGGKGCLVDVVRRFWPDRKAMYTCWNTKISARESNYGTRIDYILVTPGLLPWIKAADIQPEIRGSDHCPVFIDLHGEIVDSHGVTVKLCDVLQAGRNDKGPPRLCAKFWDEYSGKQRLLDTFFGKKGDPVLKSTSAPALHSTSQTSDSPTKSTEQVLTLGIGNSLASPPRATSAVSPSREGADHPQSLSSGSRPQEKSVASTSTVSALKRKQDTREPGASSSKRPKKETPKAEKAEQTSLSTFFSKPTPSSPNSKAGVDDMIDADYRLALSLSQESPPPRASGNANNNKSKQLWTSLLAPIQPPKCIVHDEPTKELTVNKPGSNKGKNFFICARPVGPGYDKGKAERLREEVDPTWRCDFFKWSSEVRLEMTRKMGEDGLG
ncbi:Endonuclease/exonuclease/phosphatase [Mycena sp. CBHHK59/15]|nr:Endonuclease/exonuclease/phosphatase [Mycena sp. CBHHK59/15]